MNAPSLRLPMPMPGPAFGPYPERAASASTPVLASTWRWLPVGEAHKLRRPAAADAFAQRVRQQQQATPAVGSTDFAQQLRALRAKLGLQGLSGRVLEQAFGLVLAATQDILGLQLYDTQLLAARILLDNRLAEMASGEGKTHAVMLAAATAALAGVPVHVVSANPYLAARDAQMLAPLYAALGLQVAAAQPGQTNAERRSVWAADVAYTAARELIFDYLRDRQLDPGSSSVGDSLSQRDAAAAPLLRGLCMAIVDEADNVLIDEASTPFVMAEESTDKAAVRRWRAAMAAARRLQPNEHFQLLPVQLRVQLGAAGRAACPAAAGPEGDPLWRHDQHRLELVETALAALHLYRRDLHYRVRGGQLELIDATNSRVTPGRRWQPGLQQLALKQPGLHQMIELSQGLQPSAEQHTTAQMSFQRFFTRYWRLCGTSATLREVRGELQRNYGLAVQPVPLRLPRARAPLTRWLFAKEADRWAALVRAVAAQHASGRPVLVGCDSLADVDRLGGWLQALGLRHQRLDARQSAGEAACVARAGEIGAITVAVRMAGSGAGIRLAPGVHELGGLFVIDAQLNSSARIERQLHGRCARAGEPGEVLCLLSQQSQLMTQECPALLQVLLRALMCLGAGRLASLRPGSSPLPCAQVLPGWLALPWLRLLQARVQARECQQRGTLARQDEKINRQLGFGGRFE